jgi:PRTRC genetic system protein B
MRANELKEALEQRQIPQMALVVYQNNQTHSLYVETHPIDKQGKMLAGKPLTKTCITELVEAFTAEQINRQPNIPHGKIPPNMLYCDPRKGQQRYVWYNPPQKRMMFFKKEMNIQNREYYLPGIIYDTSGESLDVYAFKGKKPKPKDILYKAPLFNVTDASVCLGVANINYPNNPTFDDFIMYWETKFWNTEFSHLGGKKNPTRNNLVTVTKLMTDFFNDDELLPFEKNNKPFTLKDLLKK